MGLSSDRTATLNVFNVGSVTTEHGSLFQYTTAAGQKRVFLIVHRCVNLTQCEGVAMSCHSGGLFKILWQGYCD